MRVLVTGSRDWTSREKIWFELDVLYRQWLRQVARVSSVPGPSSLESFIVVHGDAVGADRIAADWCRARRDETHPPVNEPHPADWSRGKQAGPTRNHEMVRLGADYVLAFFQAGAKNSGTGHCVGEARRWLGWKGVQIKEVWSDDE